MIEGQLLGILWSGLGFLVHLGFVARAVLRPHREPASRVAWVVVILGAAGGRHRGLPPPGGDQHRPPPGSPHARGAGAVAGPGSDSGSDGGDPSTGDPRIVTPPCSGSAIRSTASNPSGGNRARLLPDSNAAIESLVADIDAARDHVHLTLLHLAAGQQRAQGGRGAEAGRRPRGHLPGDGRRPRLPHPDGLRNTGGPCASAGVQRRHRPADRQSCCCGRSEDASTCGTTARSW